MSINRTQTRIQRKNRAAILDAALDVFSQNGFPGSTVNQIATAAGLSKANILYYFPTKDAIYTDLLEHLMDRWMAPLQALDPQGDPVSELMAYVRRKMQISQDMPRESRLFANEIVQGAPRILHILSGDMKTLVDEKAIVVQAWMDAGHLPQLPPHHLFFSIWALTQHYADFDAQVRALLGSSDPFETAPDFVDTVFQRILTEPLS